MIQEAAHIATQNLASRASATTRVLPKRDATLHRDSDPVAPGLIRGHYLSARVLARLRPTW